MFFGRLAVVFDFGIWAMVAGMVGRACSMVARARARARAGKKTRRVKEHLSCLVAWLKA